MTSCLRKDGKLQVINQSPCTYNIFEGSNANTGYLGTVAPTQTSTFSINNDDFFDINQGTFAADPVNCLGRSTETYDIPIMKGETATMLID